MRSSWTSGSCVCGGKKTVFADLEFDVTVERGMPDGFDIVRTTRFRMEHWYICEIIRSMIIMQMNIQIIQLGMFDFNWRRCRTSSLPATVMICGWTWRSHYERCVYSPTVVFGLTSTWYLVINWVYQNFRSFGWQDGGSIAIESHQTTPGHYSERWRHAETWLSIWKRYGWLSNYSSKKITGDGFRKTQNQI